MHLQVMPIYCPTFTTRLWQALLIFSYNFASLPSKLSCNLLFMSGGHANIGLKLNWMVVVEVERAVLYICNGLTKRDPFNKRVAKKYWVKLYLGFVIIIRTHNYVHSDFVCYVEAQNYTTTSLYHSSPLCPIKCQIFIQS